VPAPAGAPLPADETPQPIDVESDPEVEKIDDKGESEETESGSEELDITELVDSQKNIETKQEEYFNNLFSQLSDLQSKLSEMDTIMTKLNSLENKIEKYREKTPQEKLELRSYDSYPFNQKLSQFFDDKQEEMEKTGKNDYILTADEVTDINVNDIKNSFQPGSIEQDPYKTSFR
jgi:TolA-binding protein